MSVYLITYKVSKKAQTKHTCTRFYPDYEAACNDCFLAEAFPEVVILSVEPTTDPRQVTVQQRPGVCYDPFRQGRGKADTRTLELH